MLAMEDHTDESWLLLCSCSFARASECNNRGVDNLKGGNFRDGIQNFRKSLTLLRSLVLSDFCSDGCSCPLRAVVSLHRRNSKNPQSRNSSKQQTIQQEKEEDTKEGQPHVIASPSSNSAEPLRWHAPLESHAVFDDLLYIETASPLITPSSMPVALVEGADSHQEDGRLEPSAGGRHAIVVGRPTLEDTATDPASSVKGGNDPPWIPDGRSQEKAERVDLIVTAVIFNCALSNHLMNRIGNATPQATISEGTGSQRSKEKAIALYRNSIALLTLEKPRPTSSLNDSPPKAHHEQGDLMRDVILMASLNNLLCLMDQNDPQRQPFVSAFADFMHQCASKAGGALGSPHQDEAQFTRAQVFETNNDGAVGSGGDATQCPLEDLNNKWLPTIIGNAFLMQLESLGIICRSHCSPAA